MVSSGDGWFRLIADVFGCMVLDGSGWFWMLADGFLWFAVSVATVKFVALNLKEVGNYGDFFCCLATMTLKFP